MKEITLEKATEPNNDIEGIDQAIAKYSKMKEILSQDNLPINTGEDSEALCKKYNYHNENGVIRPLGCKGCPIMKETGKPKCEDTPWKDIEAMSLEIFKNPEMFETSRSKMMQACEDEIKFLKSLRERATHIN
jgi:hypothetical protein